MFETTHLIKQIMDGVDTLASIINEKDEEISILQAKIEDLENEK